MKKTYEVGQVLYCRMCNCYLAESDEGFKNHYKKYHGIQINDETQVAIRKKSPHEKRQIIRKIESKLSGHIIGVDAYGQGYFVAQEGFSRPTVQEVRAAYPELSSDDIEHFFDGFEDYISGTN